MPDRTIFVDRGDMLLRIEAPDLSIVFEVETVTSGKEVKTIIEQRNTLVYVLL